MNNGKDIRIYGTLVNHTVDPEVADSVHNDTLSYAKQSYDDQFGEPVKVNNYQDIINKRIKGITRTPGTGTFVNEDFYVDGRIFMKDGNGNWVPIDLASILNRLTNLENSLLWDIDPSDSSRVIPKVYSGSSRRAVNAPGFFDTTVS